MFLHYSMLKTHTADIERTIKYLERLWLVKAAVSAFTIPTLPMHDKLHRYCKKAQKIAYSKIPDEND